MRRAGIKSQNAEAEDALSAQFVAPRSGAVMNKGAKCRERVQETQTIRSILPSPHETSLISLAPIARRSDSDRRFDISKAVEFIALVYSL